VTTFPANILGSLHIARRALLAHQTALNTIGHNLANAATPGYTRQRTELEAASPQLGVDVQTIRRIRDRFLDFSLLTERQTLGRAEGQDGLLRRLEGVFNESPGTGLGPTLDQFFQAWQDLSVNPADRALRVTAVQHGERLAATLVGLRTRVDQLKKDLTTEIQNRVSDANSLLTEIAELHRQIIASRGGPPPNDLADRRDELVARLAQIIGVAATDRPDGTVQLAVTGTGVLLMDGTSTAPLTATVNTGTDTVNLTVGAGAIAITPKSGALAAAVDARNSATGPVKQAVADLNALASAVVAEVNRVHAGGAGLSGHSSLTATNAVSSSAVALTAAGLPYTPVTGSFKVVVHDAAGAVLSTVTVAVTAGTTTLENVRAALDADANLTATISGGKLTLTTAAGTTFAFAGDSSDTLMALGLNTFFTGSDALTIAVNPLVSGDPGKLAAAQADAAGLVHPGDGANALALARLRGKAALSASTLTFTEFYATLIGRVGSQTRDAAEALDRQQAAVQVVEGLQQQVSGVSTDEELIALTQSQNAYAAAAKYVTTIQELLETLLNMG
jgi:flagellar hook-associated protein 1 FlgK